MYAGTHCNPDGTSLPSWCNWTVIDCNTKGYASCSQLLYLQNSVCSAEKRRLTQSHSRNGFLIGTEILRRPDVNVAPACVCVRLHVHVWWAKWKEMWIWVMSSFLNPHFLFRYLYPDPPPLLPSTFSSPHQPTLPRLIPPYLGPFPLIDLY